MNADQGNGDQKFDLFLKACDNLRIAWCPRKFMETGMPFTRKPDVQQALFQDPTVIDHVALDRRGSQSESSAKWSGTPRDHAVVGTDVFGFNKRSKKRRPLKWVPAYFRSGGDRRQDPPPFFRACAIRW